MADRWQNLFASLESEADLSFEALAARQGVKPVAAFEDLLGSPATEDESSEEFEYPEGLAKRRRPQFQA
jgi:hypothetical protein